MKVLLKNAIYLNWQTLEFKHTNIIVDGINVQFVDDSQIPQEKFDTIDCTGKIVTKSFVVGHHHAYSALARGMGAPKRTLTTSTKYSNMFGGLWTSALTRRWLSTAD